MGVGVDRSRGYFSDGAVIYLLDGQLEQIHRNSQHDRSWNFCNISYIFDLSIQEEKAEILSRSCNSFDGARRSSCIYTIAKINIS